MTTDARPALLLQAQEFVLDAARDVFADFGLPLTDSHVQPSAFPVGEEAVVTSVVGYTGEQMRGALILLVTGEVAARWARVNGGDPTPDTVADTVGELSNMVLGRLKYTLLLNGTTVMLATPTTATGMGVHFTSRSGGESFWARLSAPSGSFALRFDATFEPGLVFTPQPADTGAPAGSGDALMF